MTTPAAPGPEAERPMTTEPTTPVDAPPARKRDVLGIVAVIVAAIGLLPTLAVFLIGLVPEMNAIWWLGIIIIPLLAMLGVVVLVLAIIGIVVGVRRHSRFVWSIVAAVLGLLMVAPMSLLFLESATI